MEDLIEKIGWKKMAIILIGVSLAGLIFVFLSLLNMDKTQTNKIGNTITGNSGNANSNSFEITKTPQQKRSENSAKTYITPFYQIYYPESFSSILYSSSGVLSSIALVNSNSSIRIEIIVLNSQENSIESVTNPFIALGYEKIPFSSGYSGVKYQGTIKSVPVLHETVVILMKDSNIVRMLLGYKGNYDSGIESTFDAIVNSLK